MSLEDRIQRRAGAAAEFDQHENRSDGTRVANALADGLNTLRDLFFTRVHADVESEFGMDSMVAPISESKVEVRAKAEIDLYQIGESAAFATQLKLVGGADDWYCQWLAHLRLSDGMSNPAVLQRLAQYAAHSSDKRRLTFSSFLERALPEARRAPLVVYRLLPLAVGVTTALAFGNQLSANDIRKQQVGILPGIADCHDCHGRLLDIGEVCPQCGNPFWKYNWLTSE